MNRAVSVVFVFVFMVFLCLIGDAYGQCLCAAGDEITIECRLGAIRVRSDGVNYSQSADLEAEPLNIRIRAADPTNFQTAARLAESVVTQRSTERRTVAEAAARSMMVRHIVTTPSPRPACPSCTSVYTCMACRCRPATCAPCAPCTPCAPPCATPTGCCGSAPYCCCSRPLPAGVCVARWLTPTSFRCTSGHTWIWIQRLCRWIDP